MKWYVVNHETDAVVRGPFTTAEAAGAVRDELERNPEEKRNLWVMRRDLAAERKALA